MKLLLLIFTFIISNSLLSIEPIIISKDKGEYPIGLYLEILEDKDGKLTIDDVQKPEMEKLWFRSKWEIPSFGFTKTVYWVRFKIQAISKKEYFLEIGYSHHDQVDFYYYYSDEKINHKKTGDFLPFEQRDLQYRNFVFLITPDNSDKNIYYLRLESRNSMQFPMTIWSPIKFSEMINTEMIILGLYFGVMISMALYNLFLWMSVRDKSYFYYVCYILSNIIALLNFNGLNYQYIWSGSPLLYNQLIPTSMLMVIIFATVFTSNFLFIKNNLPVYHRIYRVIFIFLIIGFISSPFVSYRFGMVMGLLSAIMSAIWAYTVSCIMVLRKYRPARFYLLGWSVFLFGGIFFCLQLLGFVTKNKFTAYSLQFASVFEVLLLSLGLADRINELKWQNELIQIKNQEELKKLNVELEQKVNDRTYNLELSKEKAEKAKKQAEIEKGIAIVAQNEAEFERKKSDKLLLNILPKKIADELKIKGVAEPVMYESVSVLFTDFKGFTKIAENMNPQELIAELDRCFSYFDSLMERYDLEKLKTIGDSYMCAGGIPVVNKTHAIDAVLTALEIQAFMNEVKSIRESMGFPYWELRLGIHTGPLVAGVIGEKKFAYDVWGDTVNTASRMESSGTPGMINISSATYNLVKDYFECEYRGKIQAKNKGEVEMYYVHSIKKELSKNGDEKTPNERFLELLRNLQS